MVKIISVAETPNPDALKFFVDAPLVKSGAKAYDHPASAAGDPLAEALFKIGPVQSVFYMDRFVTVNKRPEVDWSALQPAVIETIESTAQPIPQETETPSSNGGPAAGEAALLDQINRVLDENVRPALAGDGGGVEILGFKDYVLSVHYQGACGGCHSAATGTLFAIQNLLQRLVDPRIEVQQV